VLVKREPRGGWVRKHQSGSTKTEGGKSGGGLIKKRCGGKRHDSTVVEKGENQKKINEVKYAGRKGGRMVKEQEKGRNK